MLSWLNTPHDALEVLARHPEADVAGAGYTLAEHGGPLQLDVQAHLLAPLGADVGKGQGELHDALGPHLGEAPHLLGLLAFVYAVEGIRQVGLLEEEREAGPVAAPIG